MSRIAGRRVMAWIGVRKAGKWEGQGNTTNRRRDKSGSLVGPQAIDMACVSACRSVGARAAPEGFAHEFNGVSGTVGESRHAEAVS
jgi:hypothetical protein